jgi:tRNA (mo5U34)-methyltransferase
VVPQLPFPQSLAGKRCLDVATFDGFWSFEMERRGASEVIGIDILDPHAWDWPVLSSDELIQTLERRKQGGRGFGVAKEALGSAAEHRECSVYELDRSEIGEFDFVYVGSLLLHQRDPIRALERVRDVCRGQLLLVDNINLPLSLLMPRRPAATLDGIGRPWWWKMNAAAVVRAVESAGFRLVQPLRRIYMQPGPGHPRPAWNRELLRSAEARHYMLTHLKGDPHAAILAEPVDRER